MKKFLLLIIKFYQKIISPDYAFWAKSRFPYGYCKYHPSCSQFAYEAIDKFGVIKGTYHASLRIIRCNPFSKGGLDPVDKY